MEAITGHFLVRSHLQRRNEPHHFTVERPSQTLIAPQILYEWTAVFSYDHLRIIYQLLILVQIEHQIVILHVLFWHLLQFFTDQTHDQFRHFVHWDQAGSFWVKLLPTVYEHLYSSLLHSVVLFLL